MNISSLEAKLSKYYDKLQNPDKIIGSWAIIDIKLYNKLNKITLTNISDINSIKTEKLITAESKSNFIVIKYNRNFIAIKIIDTEYDYLIKDWDLIAVDRAYLYDQKESNLMTNKEIIKLLNFKLSKKAKEDLECFS